MQAIVKYPRTPHLAGSRLQPGDTAEGQVPAESLASGEVRVEEKVDGANCALSFSREWRLVLQSRGHFLSGGAREGQFNLFKAWAQTHEEAFLDRFEDRYIVYGEWSFAKHTVFYDSLPHYFLEFDIYDRQRDIFLSTPARQDLLAGLPIVSVPVIHEGLIAGRDHLEGMVAPSLYKSAHWREALRVACVAAGADPGRALLETDGSELAEGLYVKHEDDDRVIGRFKYVRAGFLQAIQESGSHWASRPIIQNRLHDDVDLFAALPVHAGSKRLAGSGRLAGSERKNEDVGLAAPDAP